MTTDVDFDDLIERSSLGSAGAQGLSRRTADYRIDKIINRSRRILANETDMLRPSTTHIAESPEQPRSVAASIPSRPPMARVRTAQGATQPKGPRRPSGVTQVRRRVHITNRRLAAMASALIILSFSIYGVASHGGGSEVSVAPPTTVPLPRDVPSSIEVSSSEVSRPEVSLVILFAAGSSVLSAAGKDVLDSLAPQIANASQIRITGYSSAEGDPQSNAVLAFRRAQACSSYLATRLPPHATRNIESVASDRRLYDESNENAPSSNRAAVIMWSNVP